MDDLYREIIVEHSQRPHNKRELPEATAHARGYNPVCGDDVTVYVRLDAASERIDDVSFTGRSCAICQASASMLTDAVAGQPVVAAQDLAGQVRAFMQGKGQADGVDEEALGDIVALGGVRKLPLRVKCATLSWNALEAALAPGGAG